MRRCSSSPRACQPKGYAQLPANEVRMRVYVAGRRKAWKERAAKEDGSGMGASRVESARARRSVSCCAFSRVPATHTSCQSLLGSSHGARVQCSAVRRRACRIDLSTQSLSSSSCMLSQNLNVPSEGQRSKVQKISSPGVCQNQKIISALCCVRVRACVRAALHALCTWARVCAAVYLPCAG